MKINKMLVVPSKANGEEETNSMRTECQTQIYEQAATCLTSRSIDESVAVEILQSYEPSVVSQIVGLVIAAGAPSNVNAAKRYSEAVLTVAKALESLCNCANTGYVIPAAGVNYKPDEYVFPACVKVDELALPYLAFSKDAREPNLRSRYNVGTVSPAQLDAAVAGIAALTRNYKLKEGLISVDPGYARRRMIIGQENLILYNQGWFYGEATSMRAILAAYETDFDWSVIAWQAADFDDFRLYLNGLTSNN